LHGGRSLGAQAGNQHGLRHGIYADALTESEHTIYDDVLVGDLVHEIKITKLRLRRAFIAERKQHELLANEDPKIRGEALILESTDTTSEPVAAENDKPASSRIVNSRVVRKATDFSEIINRLINQLVKLEGQRSLMQSGEGLSADERARLAREAVELLNAELDAEEAVEKQ
jgi:hypothetical protein